MTALPPATDRAAEQAERRGRLGSGDIAAVMGLAPPSWRIGSPFALWCEKAGLLPESEGDVTEEMEFGVLAEPMLAAYLHKRHGVYVLGTQMRCSRPDEPWMTATIDGFVSDNPDASIDDVEIAFEGKTSGDSPAEWEHPDHPYDDINAVRTVHNVPPAYAAQATWISIVTGLPTVWFGVLHFSFRRRQFRTYEFTPDAEDKALVEKTAREFWQHVVDGVPPLVDGSESTHDALRAVWPEQVPDTTVDLDELADVIARRAVAKTVEKEAKAEVAGYDNLLAAAFADAEVGCVGGVPALTYKSQVRKTTCRHCGAVDESSPFRVFRAVTAKGST